MENTELIRKKLSDADNIAYDRNILKTVGFLSLEEQSIYHTLEREYKTAEHFLSGGGEESDRCIAFFLPDYMDRETAEEESIAVIMAAAVNARYADELTHRDFLGALMNLGIERELVGDIRVFKPGKEQTAKAADTDPHDKSCRFFTDKTGRKCEPTAIIYVRADMAEYISRELTKVRHTDINCTVLSLNEFKETGIGGMQEFEFLHVNVASERVDAVIAALYRVSRQKAAEVINAERVYINGRIAQTAGKQLKEGDRVSVRGTGKFIYDGVNGTSKKGRLYADIRRFV